MIPGYISKYSFLKHFPLDFWDPPPPSLGSPHTLLCSCFSTRSLVILSPLLFPAWPFRMIPQSHSFQYIYLLKTAWILFPVGNTQELCLTLLPFTPHMHSSVGSACNMHPDCSLFWLSPFLLPVSATFLSFWSAARHTLLTLLPVLPSYSLPSTQHPAWFLEHMKNMIYATSLHPPFKPGADFSLQ